MSTSSTAAKLNCLLIGDGSLLIECGALLLAHGHPIVGVVPGSDALSDKDLKASLTSELTITDTRRFPTVAGLIARGTDRGAVNAQLGQVADCAAAGRDALAARTGRRMS